jgi:hypothetical protein
MSTQQRIARILSLIDEVLDDVPPAPAPPLVERASVERAPARAAA